MQLEWNIEYIRVIIFISIYKREIGVLEIIFNTSLKLSVKAVVILYKWRNKE